jgi:glycosyltransferase involved in cell wall biosynthesis
VPVRLAVVVPTRHAERTLSACLASIRGQVDADGRPLHIPVVVVDNHSTDTTAEIASLVADELVVAGPERSAQRNIGMSVAAERHGATAVLFVDADMVLEPTVAHEVVSALTADPACGGVIVPETSFGAGFWAACRGLEKRVALGDRRTEAARGYRVATLALTGAWDERLTAAEDWDLTDRVEAGGWSIGRTSAAVHHDEGRPTLRGVFAKKRYYGRWLAAYLTPGSRSADGHRSHRRRRVSPLRVLARPQLFLRQPHLGAGLVILKAVDATGIALGAWSARRHHTGSPAPRAARAVS